MKKILFAMMAMLLMVGSDAMAQKKAAPARAVAFNPAKLKAALMEQMGVDEADLKANDTQYLLIDIDKDGKQEILVKYHNSVDYIFTQAYGSPEILIEKTSPDEHLAISDNGMVVSEMEKSYMNVNTIYKLRRSNISDSATMSMEHITKTNDKGEEEFDEKVEEGPNYQKLSQECGPYKFCYSMEGWQPLCK